MLYNIYYKVGDNVYYDLTKQECKKHESEFKKKYIGKTLFTRWLASYIVFIVFVFEIVFGLILDYINNIPIKLDMVDIFYIVGILLIGIITVLYQIEYRKELKDYIITKGKK